MTYISKSFSWLTQNACFIINVNVFFLLLFKLNICSKSRWCLPIRMYSCYILHPFGSPFLHKISMCLYKITPGIPWQQKYAEKKSEKCYYFVVLKMEFCYVEHFFYIKLNGVWCSRHNSYGRISDWAASLVLILVNKRFHKSSHRSFS